MAALCKARSMGLRMQAPRSNAHPVATATVVRRMPTVVPARKLQQVGPLRATATPEAPAKPAKPVKDAPMLYLLHWWDKRYGGSDAAALELMRNDLKKLEKVSKHAVWFSAVEADDGQHVLMLTDRAKYGMRYQLEELCPTSPHAHVVELPGRSVTVPVAEVAAALLAEKDEDSGSEDDEEMVAPKAATAKVFWGADAAQGVTQMGREAGRDARGVVSTLLREDREAERLRKDEEKAAKRSMKEREKMAKEEAKAVAKAEKRGMKEDKKRAKAMVAGAAAGTMAADVGSDASGGSVDSSMSMDEAPKAGSDKEGGGVAMPMAANIEIKDKMKMGKDKEGSDDDEASSDEEDGMESGSESEGEEGTIKDKMKKMEGAAMPMSKVKGDGSDGEEGSDSSGSESSGSESSGSEDDDEEEGKGTDKVAKDKEGEKKEKKDKEMKKAEKEKEKGGAMGERE